MKEFTPGEQILYMLTHVENCFPLKFSIDFNKEVKNYLRLSSDTLLMWVCHFKISHPVLVMCYQVLQNF